MKKRRNTIVLGFVVTLAAGLVAFAQDYSIDRYTIDGGGEMWSTGGSYELSGTIGQHDAGEMSGGAYSLTGGFWFGIARGDCNEDGGVDLDDFVEFQMCFDGPGGWAASLARRSIA